jgi:hypothetical protein
MTTPNSTQELFDLWRRSLEEGTQAWMKAMSPGAAPQVPPTLDFTQFWRPLMTQGMDVWQQAAAQGRISPDFMQQWKQFMDHWIETWSQAMGQAMASEGFAQALGRYLDQYLAMQAPLKKGLEQYNDAALRTLGLPSRGQVVGIASQVVGLEERIEKLEDRLDELKGLIVKAMAERGPQHGTPRESA